MNQLINVRDLKSGQSWVAKLDDMESILDLASQHANLDGGGALHLRFMTKDDVLENLSIYRNAKGRLVASRDGKPARAWALVKWLFRIRKFITGDSLEFTVQIGGLTVTFDESKFAVMLQRKTFVNKRNLTF